MDSYNNGIVDTYTLKGFLSWVNGTFEHIYAINTILDNAKVNNLPLVMTFIDQMPLEVSPTN